MPSHSSQSSSEHVEPWWWLSFADGSLPEGQQFLGVAIMQGYTIEAVITESHLSGINPGGEIQYVQIPEEHIPEEQYRNRLLTGKELSEAGLV